MPPNTWDLNKVGEDGCEYACSPVPSLTEVCINGKDDNCNGAVDEGCVGDCDGPESPDDGVDGDCDGTELIHGTNAMAYLGALPQNEQSFDMGLAGLFDFGPFGEVGADGNLSRELAGQDVSWCVAGIRPDWTQAGLVFEDLNIEACRDSEGQITSTYSAVVDWESTPRAVDSTYLLSGAQSVLVPLEDVLLASSIKLVSGILVVPPTGVVSQLTGALSAGEGDGEFLGDVVGDYWTGESGPLDLPLTQAADSVWTPFAQLSLSVTDATGFAKRSGAQWSVELTTAASSLELAPSLNLAAPDLTGRTSDSTSGWELDVLGAATAGPFLDVLLEGTITESETGNSEGCLSGTASADLYEIPFIDVTLEPCLDGDNAVSTSLSGSMILEGLTMPFSGFLSRCTVVFERLRPNSSPR